MIPHGNNGKSGSEIQRFRKSTIHKDPFHGIFFAESCPFSKKSDLTHPERDDIHINPYAETFFSHPAFSTEHAENMTLVIVSF